MKSRYLCRPNSKPRPRTWIVSATELTPQARGVEIRVERDRLPGREPKIPVKLIRIDPADAQDGVPNAKSLGDVSGNTHVQRVNVRRDHRVGLEFNPASEGPPRTAFGYRCRRSSARRMGFPALARRLKDFAQFALEDLRRLGRQAAARLRERAELRRERFEVKPLRRQQEIDVREARPRPPIPIGPGAMKQAPETQLSPRGGARRRGEDATDFVARSKKACFNEPASENTSECGDRHILARLGKIPCRSLRRPPPR